MMYGCKMVLALCFVLAGLVAGCDDNADAPEPAAAGEAAGRQDVPAPRPATLDAEIDGADADDTAADDAPALNEAQPAPEEAANAADDANATADEPGVTARVAQNATQPLVEALRQYLDAVASGDEARVREAMARPAFANMHNAMLSMGQAFDASLLSQAVDMFPDPAQLKVIAVIADGPTALLVVHGAQAPLAVQMLQEEGVWRVGAAQSLPSVDVSNPMAIAGSIRPELLPTGELPATPELIDMPEVFGQFAVQHRGLKGEVTFNGEFVKSIDQPIAQSANVTNSTGLIIGGLKRGENRIEVTAEADGSGAQPLLKLVVVRTDPANPQNSETVTQVDLSDKLPGTATHVFTIE